MVNFTENFSSLLGLGDSLSHALSFLQVIVIINYFFHCKSFIMIVVLQLKGNAYILSLSILCNLDDNDEVIVIRHRFVIK